MSNIKVGDKIEYLGMHTDDEDVYVEFLENGFVHEVTYVEKKYNLIWVLGCEYGLKYDLVQKLEYN